MSEYKLFIQRIGLVGLVNLLIGLSYILIIPILTKNLSASDYGVWNQINITVKLTLNLATLGLSFSMIRYFPSIKKKDSIQEGFFSLFFVSLLTTFIISLVIILASHPLATILFNGNIDVVLITSFIVFFAALNYLIMNYFRTFQQIKKYSLFLFSQAYLNVVLATYLVLSGYGILGATIALLITNIIVFLAMLYFILKDIGFKLPKFYKIKEYLYFSLPFVLAGLATWIVESSDRYIIGIFLGNSYVGYYSPGYVLSTILVILSVPITTVIFPLASKYYDKNDINKVSTYLNYSLKLYLTLGIPITIFLSILSKQILIILTTQEIAINGFLITPIVSFGAFFYGIFNIISSIIILKKKTKLFSVIWSFAAVLSIFLNIILVPIYGILAAAFVTLLSYLAVFIFISYFSHKNFNLAFEINFVMKSIISAFIMSLFIIFINPVGILSLIIAGLISFLIYVISLFLLKGFTTEEINYIKKLFIK